MWLAGRRGVGRESQESFRTLRATDRRVQRNDDLVWSVIYFP